MPLQQVKSRVRFQGSRLKMKQGDDRNKAQYKPTRTVFDGTPESPLCNSAVDGTLFKRQRVPSTDELGNLLKSNLSSSLAGKKACFGPQHAHHSASSSVCQYNEYMQDEYDDPPASLLELTPVVYVTRDYVKLNEDTTAANGTDLTEHEPPISSLATTTIYAPPNNHPEREVQRVHAPSPILTARTQLPLEGGVEGEERSQSDPSSAVRSYTIEDDEANESTWSRPCRDPIQSHQQRQSSLLQRVVTLFAGRRRCQTTIGGGWYQRVGNQQRSTTPLSSPPQLSLRSPCCSIQAEDEAAFRAPAARRASLHFASVDGRKTLPVSPPIIVPEQHRPYQPFEERLDQPSIRPAKYHMLFGTYYVAPDIFSPKEVQIGFPGSPSGTTSPVRRLHNDAYFLDRNNTAWAKWYGKHSNPKKMSFAVAYRGQAEITDEEVWNIHADTHAQFRKSPSPPNSEGELAQRLDDEEYQRDERLRYHIGDCFGALTGFCYPFQGGLII